MVSMVSGAGGLPLKLTVPETSPRVAGSSGATVGVATVFGGGVLQAVRAREAMTAREQRVFLIGAPVSIKALDVFTGPLVARPAWRREWLP